MLDSILLLIDFPQVEFPEGNHSQQASGNNQRICSLDNLETLEPEKSRHTEPEIKV